MPAAGAKTAIFLCGFAALQAAVVGVLGSRDGCSGFGAALGSVSGVLLGREGRWVGGSGLEGPVRKRKNAGWPGLLASAQPDGVARLASGQFQVSTAARQHPLALIQPL